MVAAGLIAFTAGPLSAQGSPMRGTPAYAAPIWSGFYAGWNGGGAETRINTSEQPFGPAAIADIQPQSLKIKPSGALYGGQAGYNVQHGNMVAGVEVDFDYAGMGDSSQVTFPSIVVPTLGRDGFSASQRIDWLASIRGRVGMTTMALWKPTLLYVTGGVAYERLSTKAMVSGNTATEIFGQSGIVSFSDVKTGFVLGVGAETAIAPNWSLRSEYLYYDFNDSNSGVLTIANCNGGVACGATIRSGSNTINAMRVGLNYRFGAN
jgi:outer membrane immunogenic protein